MSIAGDMISGAPPNEKWHVCDGKYVVNPRHNDYWRRVCFRHGGAGIGGMRVPDRAGYSICIDDDPSYPPVGPKPAALLGAVIANPAGLLTTLRTISDAGFGITVANVDQQIGPLDLKTAVDLNAVAAAITGAL